MYGSSSEIQHIQSFFCQQIKPCGMAQTYFSMTKDNVQKKAHVFQLSARQTHLQRVDTHSCSHTHAHTHSLRGHTVIQFPLFG